MKIIDKDKIVDVCPKLIAEMFCNLDSSGQAQFFNEVSEISSKWSASFTFQLQYITDDDGLTYGGRRVMQEIGEYSHWGLVPHLKIDGTIK